MKLGLVQGLRGTCSVKNLGVQVELDPAPRRRAHQVGEVLDQVVLAERVDAPGKILADAAHAAGVGVYRLGLQALELEVQQAGSVLSLECFREVSHDGKSTLGGSGSRLTIERVNRHLTPQMGDLGGLLRVTAASKPPTGLATAHFAGCRNPVIGNVIPHQPPGRQAKRVEDRGYNNA